MSSESTSTVPALAIGRKKSISRWIWAPVALMLLLSGCYATSVIVGVREPDLTSIQTGDQRSRVESMLGKRLWRPGLADGLTYDIYQFEAGRPARPLFGAMGLGLDVLSMGIMEFNTKDLRKFAPAKQVAVAYDEQDRVRFVSPPWLVKTDGPCKRLRSHLPADSGVPSTARPSPGVHLDGSASEVATLELDSQIQVTIDGRKIEGRVVELPPGRHTVDYSAALGGSILYGAILLSYDDILADVELVPGRRYRLKRDRLYPGYQQRADVFWIEDVESGETLHCAWPKPR